VCVLESLYEDSDRSCGVSCLVRCDRVRHLPRRRAPHHGRGDRTHSAGRPRRTCRFGAEYSGPAVGKKSAVDPSGGQSPSAVPIDYAVTDPAPIFQAVDVDGFIGRQWLVRKLDSFMASNRSGYFMVEADAGMGKTAFAAWLVKTRGYLFYFSRLSGRSERGALQNLSAQVIKKCRLEGKTQGGFVPEWALCLLTFSPSSARPQAGRRPTRRQGLAGARGRRPSPVNSSGFGMVRRA
jgi:hypothetical protein